MSIQSKTRRRREKSPGSVLVDAATGAAEVFDCSERQFYSLRQHEDFPKPVVLGPRIIRYRRAELEAFIAKLVAVEAPAEPAQLAAGKQRKAERQTAEARS